MVMYAVNKNKEIYSCSKNLIKSRSQSLMQEDSSVLLKLIKKVNKEITSFAYVFNFSFI